MRNPREVLVAASSAAKRFEVKASKRQLVTAMELTGGALAISTLLSSCSPKGQEFVTPTPEAGQTIQLDRGDIRVLRFGAEGLTPEQSNILSAYQQGFGANPFVAENGYVFDNVSVVQAPGVNQRGENSTLEMAITSARDQSQNLVYFFQFRDENKTPTPGVLDSTVKTYIYNESDVRMTETPDGIVVDIYGLEIKPRAQQEGNPLTYVDFYQMVFDKASPHATLAELLSQGTLLETRITNPVSRKLAVIDEGRVPAGQLLTNNNEFVPVSFALRQGGETGGGTTGGGEVISTPNAISSLAPEVQELFTNQQVRYEVGDNGAITIDLYDTTGVEKINLESFQRVDTQDGLNPNILTAKDTDGNTYAYNPEHGWFKVIEVPTDVNTKLEQYAEVNEDYFTDGRANIVTSLHYAENPTISPNAIKPQWWVGFNSFRRVLGLGLFPESLGYAQQEYPEEAAKFYFNSENKPFSFTGFYKVNLSNGEIAYVMATTNKNPTEANPNQLINLFNGFDEATYEKMAAPMNNGYSELFDIIFPDLNKGSADIETMLAFPPDYDFNGEINNPFDPNAALYTESNPVLGERQRSGELFSYFNQQEQEMITKLVTESVKQGIHETVPLTSLPPELSRYILWTTFNKY